MNLTDGQLVGLVLSAAGVALCLYAAWEASRAQIRDDWESSGDERWRS